MKRLTKDHFSFKCPMNWDDLDAVASNQRFCQQCRKNVYDLTDCSIEEVQQLQREKGPICGMVRLVGATTVAASLSLASCDQPTADATESTKPEPQEEHAVNHELVDQPTPDTPPQLTPNPKPDPETPIVGKHRPKDPDDPFADKPAPPAIQPPAPVIMGLIQCPPDQLPQGDPEPTPKEQS